MKRIPFVALAVAAILIIYWSLSGGEGPAPGPSSGTAAETGSSEPPSTERIDAPMGSAEQTTDPSRSLRTEVDSPTPAPGSQVRVGHGRLVDSRGEPLADLEVSLATSEYDEDRVVVPPPINARSNAEDPRASTAADGRFSFSVPAGRVGRLVMEDDSWVLSGARHFEAPEGDFDLGDVTALRAGSVSGTVRDAAGRPAQGVRVAAGHGDPGLHAFGPGGQSVATTDDSGRYTVGRLLPGEVWIRTASPSFLPTEARLELREGEERTGVDLRVEPGAAIAGQVLDDLGRPVAGLKVGARRTAERGNLSIERYTPDEATVTDRHGMFTLAGLEGETAHVRAWGEGYTTAAEGDVPVGTGNLLLRVSRLGVVEGILVGEDGSAISGSRVRARGDREEFVIDGPDDLPLLPGVVVARTDEAGGFRLDGVRPGTVTVRATGDGHRPVAQPGVAVLPGEVTSGVRLVASRGAVVEATVLDPSGRPIADAKVQVVEPPPDPGDSRFDRRMRIEEDENGEVYHSGMERTLGTGVTDADGRVAIAGLPAKSVQVRAEHGDFAEAEPVPAVLVPGGVVEKELTLRDAGTAFVRVFANDGEPAPSARFRLRGPIAGAGTGRKWRGVTDASGEARMGSLPPGLYAAELELESPGRSLGGGTFVAFGDVRVLPESRVEFTVAAQETTDVSLHRPILATVRGSVRDANGPVSGAVVELEPAEEASGGPGGVYNARSGADGSYSIPDLSAGSYVMRYGRTDQVVKAEEVLEIPPAQPVVEKDLRLLGGILRITVLDAGDADPVEGAEVTIERADGATADRPRRQIMMVAITADSGGGETMRMSLGDNSVRTDTDGVAEIRDVPPGRYDVRIRHDDHATFELPDQVVVDGGVTECGTAELEPAGILTGRVRDAAGGEVRMAMVEYWNADEPGDREMRTAMNGTFRLAGLTPGRYLLRARAIAMGPGTSGSDFGPEREVEVHAGRNPPLDLRTR